MTKKYIKRRTGENGPITGDNGLDLFLVRELIPNGKLISFELKMTEQQQASINDDQKVVRFNQT